MTQWPAQMRTQTQELKPVAREVTGRPMHSPERGVSAERLPENYNLWLLASSRRVHFSSRGSEFRHSYLPQMIFQLRYCVIDDQGALQVGNPENVCNKHCNVRERAVSGGFFPIQGAFCIQSDYDFVIICKEEKTQIANGCHCLPVLQQKIRTQHSVPYTSCSA